MGKREMQLECPIQTHEIFWFLKGLRTMIERMLEWISMRFWFVLFSTMYLMKFLCFIRKGKSSLAACWNVIETVWWKEQQLKKWSLLLFFWRNIETTTNFRCLFVCVCAIGKYTKEVRIGRKMHLLNRLTHIIAKEPHNADYYTLLNVSRRERRTRDDGRDLFLCLTASYCFNLLPSI